MLEDKRSTVSSNAIVRTKQIKIPLLTKYSEAAQEIPISSVSATVVWKQYKFPPRFFLQAKHPPLKGEYPSRYFSANRKSILIGV